MSVVLRNCTTNFKSILEILVDIDNYILLISKKSSGVLYRFIGAGKKSAILIFVRHRYPGILTS